MRKAALAIEETAETWIRIDLFAMAWVITALAYLALVVFDVAATAEGARKPILNAAIKACWRFDPGCSVGCVLIASPHVTLQRCPRTLCVRPWRMLGTIRGPPKRGSAIATSSIRSASPSWRRIGSRILALVTEDDPYDREIEAVERDGSFEFHERYLRRSIYGFKKKQLQLCRLVFPRH